MTDAKRKMHLAIQAAAPGHPAGWRVPGGERTAGDDVAHYQNVARICEKALLDVLFLANSPSFTDDGRSPTRSLDPVVLITACALATRAPGASSHRLDHVQSALQPGAIDPDAGHGQSRTRRLEHRDNLGCRCRPELRYDGNAAQRSALRDGGGLYRGRSRALGQLGRRRPGRRRQYRCVGRHRSHPYRGTMPALTTLPPARCRCGALRKGSRSWCRQAVPLRDGTLRHALPTSSSRYRQDLKTRSLTMPISRTARANMGAILGISPFCRVWPW